MGHGDREDSPGGDADLLRYYAVLLAFFRARLSRRLRGDAEDLAQETLFALLRHQAAGGEPIRDAVAYLHGIANKKLKNHVRNDQRNRRKVEAFARERDVLTKQIDDVVAWTRLEEKRRQQALVEALKWLDGDELEILQLRYVNDALDNAEAARRLGISAPEASRLFYKAKERLRKVIAADRSRER